jgi:hypothetical protein
MRRGEVLDDSVKDLSRVNRRVGVASIPRARTRPMARSFAFHRNLIAESR